MKSFWPKAGVTALALSCALATTGHAEEKSTDDLMKEIEALKVMMQGIQKDLTEVKGMLARQAQAAPPPSGVGTVLDLGGAMVKGEKTAKLTLVEVSDYQ
jgi:protein-disulfide isomerase